MEKKNGANPDQFHAAWQKVPKQFILNYLRSLNLALVEFETTTQARRRRDSCHLSRGGLIASLLADRAIK